MNLTTALYLTDLVDNMNCSTSFVLAAGVITLTAACVGKLWCSDKWADEDGHADKMWTSIIKKWWMLMPILAINCLFPAKSTMYMMLGSSYLQESNIPKKVSAALELKLDDYLTQLTSKKKERE